MFGILSLLNILLFPVFLFGFVVLVCQLVSWGTARRISVSKVRKLIVKWRVPGPGSKMPLVEGCCVIFRSVGRRNHPWFLRGYREYHELLVNYSYLELFLILETLPPIVSSVQCQFPGFNGHALTVFRIRTISAAKQDFVETPILMIGIQPGKINGWKLKMANLGKENHLGPSTSIFFYFHPLIFQGVRKKHVQHLRFPFCSFIVINPLPFWYVIFFVGIRTPLPSWLMLQKRSWKRGAHRSKGRLA